MLRLYECLRRRGPVKVRVGFPFREVWRTDLLENWRERLEVADEAVTLQLRPHEIVTLRFQT